MDPGFRYKQCLTIRTELAAVLIKGLYRWDPTGGIHRLFCGYVYEIAPRANI